MKKILPLILTPIFLLSGCSKNPESISEVDEILNSTQTTAEQRTKQWYADQEEVRDSVLGACIRYFNNKGEEKGGEYGEAVVNDIYSKFSEVHECNLARQGEILNMSRGKTMLTEVQLNDIQVELENPSTIDHINQVSEQVAKHLESVKENDPEANQTIEAN